MKLFAMLLLFLVFSVLAVDHHTKNGFRNTSPDFEEHNFSSVFSWRFKRMFKELPSLDPEDYTFSVLENDGIRLKKNNPHPSLTWVGHATVYIQLDAKGILTDPIWSERCSPVSWAGPKRYTPPGLDMDKIPYLHYVVISHSHYDHMDLPTLKKLDEKFKPVFITGLGNKKLLKKNGLENVVELDWWKSWEDKNMKFVFTPTQHFSARSPFNKDETLWGSFIIQGSKTFYFAGDTGYFDGFKKIAGKFPDIHTAILPVGAYEPRWFMRSVHLNPEESVLAYIDLKAKFMLPVHYSTFVLSDEALDAPLHETEEHFSKLKIPADRLLPLKIGESRFFRE